MTTKPTKKDIRAAILPMRKAAERYASSLMTGHKAAKHASITWRGLTIEVEIVRRQQVVCNVPAPYCAFHLYYKASRDGRPVAHGDNGTSLIDNLFAAYSRGLIQF